MKPTLHFVSAVSSMFLAARSLWMKPFLERYSIASAISWQKLNNWFGMSISFLLSLRMQAETTKYNSVIEACWHKSLFPLNWPFIQLHQVTAQITTWKELHCHYNLQFQQEWMQKTKVINVHVYNHLYACQISQPTHNYDPNKWIGGVCNFSLLMMTLVWVKKV